VRLREFSITRYGPLKDTGRVELGDFNLLFGRNEEGKTLTIDALVKLLLGGGAKIRDFERIDRVDESPEGYVILEDDEGNESKLPEKGNLTDLLGLTPSQCRNIFIIRNSDLSIATEADFYEDVTDRLTGLRTEDISRIEQALRELGRATETGRLSNTAKDGKLKDRVEKAQKLLEEIKELSGEIQQVGFDGLEQQAAGRTEELERIARQIEDLEDARQRERYEKGREALDELKRALEDLAELQVYNEQDERRWRECERTIRDCESDSNALAQELKDAGAQLEKKGEELGRAEAEFSVLEQRKRTLDEEIRSELKDFQVWAAEPVATEGIRKFLLRAGTASALLLGLCLLGLLVSDSPLFYVAGIPLLICTMVLWIYQYLLAGQESALLRRLQRLRLSLSPLGLEADDIQGMLANVRAFDDSYRLKSEELNKLEVETGRLQATVKDLKENRIPAVENKRRGAEQEVGRLKRESREDSLKDYTKKLSLKNDRQRALEKQEGILSSLLETTGETIEEKVSSWEAELLALERYADRAQGKHYSDAALDELKDAREESKRALAEIQGRMSRLRGRLKDIEREANDVLSLELEGEPMLCETAVDLNAIEARLHQFIKESEENRADAVAAIEIFQAIAREEKEKVSALFGEDSPVSKHFGRVTGGLYDEVSFSQDAGAIRVRRRDRTMLDAAKLSGGAYDQLYLAIRLVLGEKLLKGGKGFFIVDDPFIKADPVRLERQLEVLREICRTGWQVTYFTAKGEVRDSLRADIEEGRVCYHEVRSMIG